MTTKNDNQPPDSAEAQQGAGGDCPRTPCSPWLPLDDAPRDGTLIYGLYDGEGVLIRWAETRRCMLAGIGGGNGYFGAGWEDDYNGLIMDPPEAWMPEEDFEENH